jgi:hypothetical protein
LNQEDNYSRAPLAYLPTLKFNKEDPVVQVWDEQLGEVVYTIRVNGTSWRPKVFREATYTIKAWSDGSQIVRTGIDSVPVESKAVLELPF